MNLFYLQTWKSKQTIEQQPHPPRHIQLDHVPYCSV